MTKKTNNKPEQVPNKQQENIQQKYFEMQMITSQIKEQQKQMQLVENQLIELAIFKKSLDDFEKVQKGTEIKIPLCPGIFAEAELKNNKELLVNIGVSVVVKKTIDETKKIIEKQFVEIQKIQRKSIENIQQLNLKADKIERELSLLSK